MNDCAQMKQIADIKAEQTSGWNAGKIEVLKVWNACKVKVAKSAQETFQMEAKSRFRILAIASFGGVIAFLLSLVVVDAAVRCCWLLLLPLKLLLVVAA